MLHNIKIELLDNINVLHNLAKEGIPSFPDELCLFISNEFNLKSAAILKEKESGTNDFAIFGKSSSFETSIFDRKVSIEEYNSFIESENFEHDYYRECILTDKKEERNLQSIAFRLNKKLCILMLKHKISPSDVDREKYLVTSRFILNFLRMWKNINTEGKFRSNVKSMDFLLSITNGLIKEIETMSGLLTLLKEEKVSISGDNYLNELKSMNQFMLNSINDLSTLLKLEDIEFETGEININIEKLVDLAFSKINKNHNNVKIEFDNFIKDDISYNSQILDFIILNSLHFVALISKSQKVKIVANLNSDNNLLLSFTTDTEKMETKLLNELFKPFSNRTLVKDQSGFAMPILAKYVEMLNGNIKLIKDKQQFAFNISLPTTVKSRKKSAKVFENNTITNKDRILVIESDTVSSTLLKNHLSKWNYHTEIVNTGSYALSLIKENKYVAVILNIEQENDNSLELLQKIKNNKLTRNTPVIVFSVEIEQEKIYLMGSVDYLVKPINYNNLIEILTRYKLRRNSTILCVDDDQPTLNLVKQAVNTAGFNVLAEYRPELVMDLIKDKEPDLAIIDLDMPKLNGFDLIKLIKSEEKFAKLPIIIYTGKDDYQEDLQKIDGLFVDLLDKKSTSFNELENTIIAMIKSYEEPIPYNEIIEQTDGPTILMAEDYKHSQIIVTRLLKKSGFENIIVVENGEEALHICEGAKIDLVLMDMQMPVMNGFEATGKIRELDGYADTPIIALTAFAMKGDREKCLEAGATDYIAKPIDSKEFIEKVKYYTQIPVKI